MDVTKVTMEAQAQHKFEDIVSTNRAFCAPRRPRPYAVWVLEGWPAWQQAWEPPAPLRSLQGTKAPHRVPLLYLPGSTHSLLASVLPTCCVVLTLLPPCPPG